MSEGEKEVVQGKNERDEGEDGDLGGEKVLNMGRRVTRNRSVVFPRSCREELLFLHLAGILTAGQALF